MTETDCPFCDPLPEGLIFYRDQLVMGLWDTFPVSKGHALLVPVRHVPTWFDASSEERIALIQAIDVARKALERTYQPHGYNIGINSGEAAGQTVFHLHVHLIPRYRGDVLDPRGGVRHVIPSRGNYLFRANTPTTDRVLVTGGDDPLLPGLKDHLAQSKSVDIAVAFTMRSGLELIHPYLEELLSRKGRLRILTGDYLDTTDPDALLRLLDLDGDIHRRVFESARGLANTSIARSFHPKAYVFHHRDGSGAAFVGSSNLSASALTDAVEWNYRVISSRDATGLIEIEKAFEALFHDPASRELTPEWVAKYRARRAATTTLAAESVAVYVTAKNPPIAESAGVEADLEVVVPLPHSIQQEALSALLATRMQGRKAGLVVLATGLGKTWLSAFDSTLFKRVLFVAHREEILGQALETFRRIRPHDYFGRYTGQEKSAGAPVLFASIQALSRTVHLQRFSPYEFDYIVVDEFHHAEARTYRRLIDYFRPKFLLGLTATPERTDGADLLALCDQNLVYRCDLTEGIRRELLCPFRYFGVPDDVDYRNIPWRNNRFDVNELEAAVATQARAENALDQYRKRGGKSTIAFCVSQRHADFMAEFFRKNGVNAVAVHSGPQTAPRARSLEQLRDGELDVICAVDILNEGVDLPELDTIMMLRPTESRIIWLQQFGRGLRRGNLGKTLSVIDYIGNHRTFLIKPQTLFGLPAGDSHILNLLEKLEAGDIVLPQGCEVTYELEAKDILKALLRIPPDPVALIRRRYQDFLEIHGVRPTAAEVQREGYHPRTVRPKFGSWLGFVKSEDGLAETEQTAFTQHRDFLESVETTPMMKSYKMLVLLAMLNSNQVPGSLSLNELAQQVVRIAEHSTKLAADVGTSLHSLPQLESLLVKNPIEAWVKGKGMGGRHDFAYDENEKVFSMTTLVSSEDREGFQEMVREIVDWRLAEYLDRSGDKAADSYTLRIGHAGGQPVLLLPTLTKDSGLPQNGHIDVRVETEIYSTNVAEDAIAVLRKTASEANMLPGVLKKWFGPDTGLPGTRDKVSLHRTGDEWSLEPLGATALTAVLWKAYQRDEIAPLFCLSYSQAIWNVGFIMQDQHILLLVTLPKPGKATAHQNTFLSPNRFQWESQDQTKQDDKRGRSIRDHKDLGIDVHLFVRERPKLPSGKAAPFTYCGPIEFVSWEGEKPITVIWNLSEPIPESSARQTKRAAGRLRCSTKRQLTMPENLFTWIPLYTELAQKLLEFERRQPDLIALIKQIKDKGLPAISVTDREKDGSDHDLDQIDPFTFFTNFNRSVKDANRIAILGELKQYLGLHSALPTDFAAVPVVNNLMPWFFAPAHKRAENDIGNLWRLTRETLTKGHQDFDRQLLDTCLNIRRVSLAKLTMGMFWFSAHRFFSYDSNNRELALKKGIKLSAKTAEGYFRWLAEVTETLGNDFPSLSHQAYSESRDDSESDAVLESQTPDSHRYWAISPGHGGERWDDFLHNGLIAIDWTELPDLKAFDTQSELNEFLVKRDPERGKRTNDALACWQFARDMNVGDIVFANQGRRRLLGVGRVEGDYEYHGNRDSFNHIRKVTWLSTGPWDLPEEHQLSIKALTEVTRRSGLRDYVDQLVQIEPADPELGELNVPAVAEEAAPYVITDALSELFLEHHEILEILARLKRKKNVILQGPPGVGKTFLARRLAYLLVGRKDPSLVETVQFHQSYSYEDFIQGFRPNLSGGFEIRSGIFYRFCSRAQAHPGIPHVLIVDEINRGNISKIFGELLMLIEGDKRGESFSIPLAYSSSLADRFYVPENFYMIGAMNTADRSLAMVDYALRRRFAFVNLEPKFSSDRFAAALRQAGISPTLITKIQQRLGALNEMISADARNLGPGYRIGHSYFCPIENAGEFGADWYRDVIESEVRPLLEEYWTDDPKKVSDHIDRLLE